MTDENVAGGANVLDAIKAVSEEGTKRHRPGKRIIVLLASLIISVVCAALGLRYYLDNRHQLEILEGDKTQLEKDKRDLIDRLAELQRGEESPKLKGLAPVPVAVLLPNWEEGAVVDNAILQNTGFTEAFVEHGVIEAQQRRHPFTYPFKKNDATHKKITEKISTWYDEGVRIFVITMSGATDKIKDDFFDFAFDEDRYHDKPVLVATVASAEGIADRQKRVFRHYIRSEEESNMFASYVEALHLTRVYVFYVKDDYGIKATNNLRNRLQYGQQNFREFEVEVKFDDEAKSRVRDRVLNDIDKAGSGDNAAVIIIGYGPMVKFTAETIRDETGFEGKVLVVSTFTEDTWRPTDFSSQNPVSPRIQPFDDRIFTVGPVHIEGTSKSPGVVYQFSYLTLDRALTCGKKLVEEQQLRNDESFWNCWSDPETAKLGSVVGVEVEFTDNGDSHVPLRLLNKEQW